MTAQATTASELRQRGGLQVLAWPAFDAFGVDVLVTTRHGGVSSSERGDYRALNLGLHVGDHQQDVLENRRRAAAALGAGLGDFVFCQQVHGRRAEVVSRADRGRGAFGGEDAVAGTDALVTADPGTVLAVLVADCVPMVLYDPVAHVLACVHAGWRGTVARVAGVALAAMRSLGSRPADVIAGLGPAAAPAWYQVGEDVLCAVQDAFGPAAPQVIWPDGTGKWLLDTWAANRLVLRDAGVRDDLIHTTAMATGPDPGHFYSHRHARPCGRFAAMARLRPRSGP